MRKKLLVVKDRIRKLNSDSDSDEANGEYRSERTVHDEPGESDGRVCDEDGSDGGDPRQKKRQTLKDNEAGENVDRLKAHACLVCDGEDDHVLVCHEMGCPVALHELCMNIEPDFDEFGNFYCPYCWYKRQVIRSRKLKEKAVAAERALATQKAEKNKTSRGTEDVLEVKISHGRMKNRSHCENRREGGESHNHPMEIVKDQRNRVDVSEIGEYDGERKRANDTKRIDESERERRDKNQRKRIREEKHMDGFDTLEDGERIQEPQNGLCEYEQLTPENSPCISSPLSTNVSDGCDPDAHGYALVVCPRRVVQAFKEEAPHCNAVSSQKASFGAGKCSVGNRSNQGNNITAYNPATKRKNYVYHDGKRKRLYWSTEEENMLSIGVEKFSAIANKNMPWRKILEFGRRVFHEERTPTDLKDKWKNMNKPA